MLASNKELSKGFMASLQTIIIFIFQITSLILSSFDQMMCFYFICKNVLLIQHLTNTFYEFLNVLVENKIEISIEPIRLLYSSLYEYVKCTDCWISVFYGLNYVMMIPTICIFLYGIMMGDLTYEKIQYVLPNLFFISFQMVLITIIAVTVHSKVRFTILYSINEFIIFIFFLP